MKKLTLLALFGALNLAIVGCVSVDKENDHAPASTSVTTSRRTESMSVAPAATSTTRRSSTVVY